MPNRNNDDAACKLEVARMVVGQGLGVNEVAKEMNVGRTAVGRSTEQYKAELLGQSGIGKPLTSAQVVVGFI